MMFLASLQVTLSPAVPLGAQLWCWRPRLQAFATNSCPHSQSLFDEHRVTPIGVVENIAVAPVIDSQ